MNKMKEKEQIAKQSDEECKFKESSKLWNELQQEDVSFLEKRLLHLISLQEKYCMNILSQCKLSMKYHYEATNVLEKYGNQLQERKYAYRAKTYKLCADYLSHIDLYECAIDCYFRALIFYSHVDVNECEEDVFKLIMNIVACYDALKDFEMIELMVPELEKHVDEFNDCLKNVWELIKQYLNSQGCHLLCDKDKINSLIELSLLKNTYFEDKIVE